jgi:PelA/Pel-15E family pectate lyase
MSRFGASNVVWTAVFACLAVCLEAAEPLVEQARASLAKATAFMRSISAEGGYLWRYSEDLKERWGEEKATATQIWVQPPGTPSMGMVFLRAYQVTKDVQYLEAAQAAALALAKGQLESGGWDYRFDFGPQKSQGWYRRTDKGRPSDAQAARRRNLTTFDDDNTQSALRFLMAFVEAAKQKDDPQVREIREALEYGLTKMLEAQYPNGAWPQRYDGKPRNSGQFPVQRARIPEHYPREHSNQTYYGYYTLNDNTQRDCIRTMFEASRRFGKPQYLEAAKKGGDFLILAQLPAPQSAWAQQYNFNMEPAWARAFEPPAVCGGESVGVIQTLVDLYLETGEKKYLEPIPAALDWFKRSQIAPDRWARFYELHSNTPIYGDRDGKIHYRLSEISEERSSGYSWQGSYGIPDLISAVEEVQREGRDSYLSKRSRPAGPRESQRRTLESNAKRAVGSLDAQGRWLNRGLIETRVFIRNANALCDYLEIAGQ